MLPNVLFHPYHIIPSVKFIAALIKLADNAVAHVAVKLHAVVVKIRIRCFWVSDTGVHIQDILFL